MSCTIHQDRGGVHLSNEALSVTFDLTRPIPSIAAVANQLTRHQFSFRAVTDCALRFSAALHRIDITEWAFRLGSAEAGDFREDEGYAQGLFAPDVDTSSWLTVPSLNEFPIGAVGYTTVMYPGYAWYRQRFDLPQATGQPPVTLLLGGCDDQDWLAYWVYVNGELIGQAMPGADRWHVTPQFTIRPGEGAYAALRFGAQNDLAVQVRGLDRRRPGMVRSNLERYSVGSPLCDQTIAVDQSFRDVSSFKLRASRLDETPGHASVVFELTDGEETTVEARYWITDGEPVLNKQLFIRNDSGRPQTLLEVDVLRLAGSVEVSDGGWGEICVIGGELFCGLRHPAGIAQGWQGEVCLRHLPGRVIQPGEQFASKVAVLGAGVTGEGRAAFLEYLGRHGPRRCELLSLYSPYGIYDSAGNEPTEVTEELLLENLDQIQQLRARGVAFDYYAIDTGWNNPRGDLKDFDPERFPTGPARVLARVQELGMKPGLWVSPSYGPAVFRPSVTRPDLAPSFTTASPPSEDHGESPIDTPTLCLAAEPYHSMFRNALYYHAEINGVRSFKFDGHRFHCCNATHGHLLGMYSVEPLMDALIETIEQLRQRAPDVLVIWYWGVRSPWWLLHGDLLYEHGIHMEAATPADSPSSLMRQSVTVSLDQGADYAWERVPLLSQDSLGVWISDTRWGNWMKTEGWQDAWVMDIARGSMLAQLWGDISLFHAGDVDFLARMSGWLRGWEGLLGHTRRILSDPWTGEPYGYANSDGARALVAVHNPSFTDHTVSIKVGQAIGLPGTENAQHYLIRRLHPADGGSDVAASQIRAADAAVSLPLRPFQVVMLQIEPASCADEQMFPRSARSFEHSRRLVCRMTEVFRETLAWEMLDTADSTALRLARRAITGRAQYIDTEDLFRQSAIHSDPRDRALTNRQLEGACTLPPCQGKSRLIVAAQASRDGVFWHHRALFDIIRLQLTLDGRPVAVGTTPRRWHEQAGGWSWIAFSCPVEPAATTTRVGLKVQVCLPESVSLEWQAWLLRSGDATTAPAPS